MSSLRALALTEEERKRAARVGGIAALGAAALDELIPLLDDPSWVVRRAVIAALATMGDAAVPRLCALLAGHRDNETRVAAAVNALVASRGDVDPAVLILAGSPTPPIVCDALQILGRRRSTGAVPRLSELILAPDDNVALAAIEALGQIGGDAAVAPLITVVEARQFFRAFPAIDVLGRSGNIRAIRPLVAMLHEPHYGIEAARALGRIGDPAAAAPLIALLAKSTDALLRTVAIAIGEIHDRQIDRFGNATAIVAAVGRADVRTVTGRLVNCLKLADATEQAALVRVLSWLGGETAVTALSTCSRAPTLPQPRGGGARAPWKGSRALPVVGTHAFGQRASIADPAAAEPQDGGGGAGGGVPL